MPAALPSSLAKKDRTEAARFALGAVTFEWSDGTVRNLRWHGVEMLRGVSYPVRDADWGMLLTSTTTHDVTSDSDAAEINHTFRTRDDTFVGQFTLSAHASGTLSMSLSLASQRDQSINRAGFNLLHPIIGLAGSALSITHGDGSVEDTVFPRLISPAQPARDIIGLRYGIDGCRIDIGVTGEVFEMEDQRNWSDASYKTYFRPLTRPFPYEVAAGEQIEQRIAITLTGKRQTGTVDQQAAAIALAGVQPDECLPATGLAVEDNWDHEFDDSLENLRRVVPLDLTASVSVPMVELLEFDLELITSDDLSEAQAQLTDLARELRKRMLSPQQILALPKAYLKSYQPDAVWPDGATQQAVIDAARIAFPAAQIGGGVLTNFTEFNRCRPDTKRVDYISHGSAAVVHAADDLSVFQTIEALPQIFASARALAPDKPYRLGLVSIGMRSNPYGAGLVANVGGPPRTMTADDPRAANLAGAAWMVAAIAATAGCGIDLITLAAPSGPFGIVEGKTGALHPSFHVLRELHGLAGHKRLALLPPGAGVCSTAALVDGRVRAIIANCTAADTQLALPEHVRGSVLNEGTKTAAAANPAWVEQSATALGASLALAPYATAFLSFPQHQDRPA